MFDIRLIRNDPEAVARALARRGGDWDFSVILKIDARRRDLTHQVESRVAEARKRSKKIGELKRNKASDEEVEAFLAENHRLTDEAKSMEGELTELAQKQNDFLLDLPNAPHETTPDGQSADDNALLRTWGEKPVFGFKPKAHDELGETLGILDMKRAAKIAGARFALYRGAGARLERALINFMLDLHTNEHGYTEWLPPFMVNPAAMTGTGQLPKFEEDLFRVDDGKFYLIPTAEVPITNIHREEILDGRDLPLKYTASYPLFQERGRLLRPGYARPHSPAPVQQGRTRQIRPAREQLRGVGEPDRRRRGNPEAPGASLPRRHAVRGRFGFFRRQDV